MYEKFGAQAIIIIITAAAAAAAIAKAASIRFGIHSIK